MTSLTYAKLGFESRRGSMWDEETLVGRRRERLVVRCLHILLLFGVFEFVMLITIIGLLLYGINEDLFDLKINNFVDDVTQSLVSDNKVSNRKVYQGVLGLLIFLLICFLLNVFHKICKYVNCCGSVCCGQSLLCRISDVFCCMTKTKKELIEDVGVFFNDFFHQRIIPSDGIAALTYLHAQTKAVKDRRMSLRNGASKIHYYP